LFRKLFTCNWERKGNFELSCSIYFYETLFYEISFGTDLNIFSADEKKDYWPIAFYCRSQRWLSAGLSASLS